MIKHGKGILQTCLSNAWGGLEMVAFETALKMTACGHCVTTVCPPESPLFEKLKEFGLEALPMVREHKYISPDSVLAFRRILKTGDYATVLVEMMSELWQLVPALWGMENVRLVGISHTLVDVSKKDLFHRWLYRRMHRLIALTDIHRRNLIENLPIEATQIEVLPNSVDVERFQPSRRSETFRAKFLPSTDEILIGVVSRLDLGKGVLEVMHVANHLRQRGVKFRIIIAGGETAGSDGSAKAALDRASVDLSLQNHVFLLGYCNNIEAVIASLDLLLMPSPRETFGRVLIEAMASGVPIVASSGGGVPDIVENGRSGLLVPPQSPEKMADAIEQLYRDPERRARMGNHGRSTAVSRFDEKTLDPRLYDILGLIEPSTKAAVHGIR